MTMQALPFTLSRAPSGIWFAAWPAQRLRVYVDGDASGPHAALAATLGELVTRWDAIALAVAAYVRALPPDHHVPLESQRPGESIGARNCGFASAVELETLRLAWPEEPTRAEVTFCTGEPDGYVSYRVRLEGGAPVALSAFLS